MESSCVYRVISLIIPVLLVSLTNMSRSCTTLAVNKKVRGDRNYHNSRPYSSLKKTWLGFCMLESKVSVFLSDCLVLLLLCFFPNKEYEA